MNYVPANMVIELDKLLDLPNVPKKIKDQLIELADELEGIQNTIWSNENKSRVLIKRYEQLKELVAAR